MKLEQWIPREKEDRGTSTSCSILFSSVCNVLSRRWLHDILRGTFVATMELNPRPCCACFQIVALPFWVWHYLLIWPGNVILQNVCLTLKTDKTVIISCLLKSNITAVPYAISEHQPTSSINTMQRLYFPKGSEGLDQQHITSARTNQVS